MTEHLVNIPGSYLQGRYRDGGLHSLVVASMIVTKGLDKFKDKVFRDYETINEGTLLRMISMMHMMFVKRTTTDTNASDEFIKQLYDDLQTNPSGR